MWKTISYSSFSYDSETLSALVIYGDSFVYGLRRMGFINNWKKKHSICWCFMVLDNFIFCIIHIISHQVSICPGSHNDCIMHKMLIFLKNDYWVDEGKKKPTSWSLEKNLLNIRTWIGFWYPNYCLRTLGLIIC